MNKYYQEIIEFVQTRYEKDEIINTDIEALGFHYTSQPSEEFLVTVYEPSLCVIVQGSKAVSLGNEIVQYSSEQYLLASVHLPAKVKIVEASQNRAFLSLKIIFSMEQVFDVLRELEDDTKKFFQKPQRGLYFGEMDAKLLEPIVRLVRLLDAPQDIRVLSPLIIKEILYILMCDKGGDFIRQFVMDGSATQRIVEVITKIKNDFKEPINFKELAKSVSMSESSLYQNFKKVTFMSPLQFQKNLRLQEAKRILLTQKVSVAQTAFEVGYTSPSQFSREYARMYGLAPKMDKKRLNY
jgi:AraC-like DNA-binding protein